MTSSRSALLLSLLFAPVALAAPEPPTAERVKADEEVLQSVGLDVDGPALLTFFRNRTPSEQDRKAIEGLVSDLGSDRFPVREKASQSLLSIGPPAVPALKEALNSRDLEVVCRAKRCLAVIEKAMTPELMCAAARLLAHRKPGGAVAVLLDYLPAADSESVVEEVRSALVATGFADNKPNADILKALKDDDARTRAVAAEALILSDAPGARDAARALMKDASQDVRLAVALALVGRKEKEAVEPLIDLIPKLESDQVWKVEDVLHGIAGDKAPEGGAVGTEAERKRLHEAWSKWWKDNGAGIDLAKIDPASIGRGLTLIATQDARVIGGAAVAGLVGRVMEVGKDGKVRWEIKNLQQPMAASVIAPDRVLIVEYRARKVTERNFKGEVVWEHTANTYIVAAERLPSGNTLVVTRNTVSEVDKTGKEVNTWAGKNGLIYAARRAKNGELVIVERTGFTIFDATGKETKRVAIPLVRTVVGMSFDVLPNGNILMPSYPENKVYEYDRDGKKVSEMTATQPTGVQRLSNGNTLISSRYANVVAEYDRNGKVIWEHKLGDGTVIQARRR